MKRSLGYARLLGSVVCVICTAARAQTPVLSVRLGGYTPNAYGTCRPISGIGNGSGAPCTVSSDCLPGEICGQLFRDISCSALGAVGDAECDAATGGPSKCVETAVIPTVPPITAMRCSAVDVVPGDMIGPGDTLFLEVFADEWDQTPDEGLCSNGKNSCSIGEFEPCKSCRNVGEPVSPACADDSECVFPNRCRVDKHCVATGQRCEFFAQCPPGDDCVPDTCNDFPSISVYQWTIDSSDFANAHGPASRLILGDLPCTTDTELDDCRHGYPAGCTRCSIAACEGIDADGNGVCSFRADAFVFTRRFDFIFNGLSPFLACRSAPSDATCGGALSPATAPAADDGTHKYLGTTVVTVSDWACGRFRVGLLDDPLATFLRDEFLIQIPGIVANDVVLNISPELVCTPACEDDGDPCTDDFCACAGVCVHVPILGCAFCGNGRVEDSEECDGTDAAACDGRSCRPNCTCTPPTCGDGIRDPGEACDGEDDERCGAGHCKPDCTCALSRPRSPAPTAD